MSAVSTPRTRITGHWEVTIQALRAARRTLFTWVAALAGLIALYAVIWPSVRGNSSWRNLFDTLPQTYRALFTASGTIDLSTAGGYLGVELMGFMGPALIAVYAITTGAAALGLFGLFAGAVAIAVGAATGSAAAARGLAALAAAGSARASGSPRPPPAGTETRPSRYSPRRHPRCARPWTRPLSRDFPT